MTLKTPHTTVRCNMFYPGSPFTLLTCLLSSTAIAGTPAEAIQEALVLNTTPTATPHVVVSRNDGEVRGIIADVVPLTVDHVLHEVLLCYGAYTDWFPLQTAARYVGTPTQEAGVIYGAFSFPWPIGVRDFEADITGSLLGTTEAEGYRIDFNHRTGTGNVKMMKGHWLLQPYGTHQTLVVYDSTIDFDTWVPGFLLARGTEQFLPAILEKMGSRTSACPADLKG